MRRELSRSRLHWNWWYCCTSSFTTSRRHSGFEGFHEAKFCAQKRQELSNAIPFSIKWGHERDQPEWNYNCFQWKIHWNTSNQDFDNCTFLGCLWFAVTLSISPYTDGGRINKNQSSQQVLLTFTMFTSLSYGALIYSHSGWYYNQKFVGQKW